MKSLLSTLSVLLLCPVICAQTDSGITKSFTEPFEQSIAASAETGIIISSAVKEGDRVQVGDVLATINHNVLKQELEIAKTRAASTARLDAATSQCELIESQKLALESLVADGHTNKYEVQQKQAEYETAYAEYRAAQDELALNQLEVKRIEAQISGRIIKSPINGFVIEIHKQLGEYVSTNEPQYATIVRVDKLKVRFYQTAATLQQLKPGQTVNIYVGSSRTQKQAIITYVSPVIDPDSGLGRVDVVSENPDLSVQSGVICFWGGPSLILSASEDNSDTPVIQR